MPMSPTKVPSEPGRTAALDTATLAGASIDTSAICIARPGTPRVPSAQFEPKFIMYQLVSLCKQKPTDSDDLDINGMFYMIKIE